MVSHKRSGALCAPAQSVTDLAVGSSDWLGKYALGRKLKLETSMHEIEDDLPPHGKTLDETPLFNAGILVQDRTTFRTDSNLVPRPPLPQKPIVPSKCANGIQST